MFFYEMAKKSINKSLYLLFQVGSVNENTKPLPPVQSLRRNKGSEFSCMMKEAKMLGMALGIPSLDG
jgi:hypothetical protein